MQRCTLHNKTGRTGSRQMTATKSKEDIDNQPGAKKSAYKRLTINLTPELHAELTERAERRGLSITDLIRRAVALDKFVDDNLQQGGRVLVERAEEVREVVLI